ncbi:MAG: aromatic ring-hydroxylating dioxygenase subunit alpha [Proteobacteria bacterium]|jgi:phenylpropionate dioxygenase-like ring-hydroxylating dioxygenase large terminal subunit|nr:aromatic ring-hydroxylating dioxygenase subunit alpha [Pseudomonadota bacterium]
MSDLAAAARLRQSESQFPAAWYCEPRVLDAERVRLFAQGPGYVGHELMAPEPGDYQALIARDDAQMLVHGADGVELLSNVCRHRQAIMLHGRGHADTIVCPVHRWTYGLDGRLLGAPHFATQPCASLARTPMQRWRGLLFDGPRDVAADLAKLSIPDLDFEGYALNRIEVHECRYNWKTFIEVYLEDYHVGPFHPGLGQFVTCDDLHWQFADWASVQRVGVNDRLAKPGTQVYRRWHQALLDYERGGTPPHGAIWLTYFPNIMVEWYPHVLVISTLVPKAVDHTLNVIEFYYPEDIALFEPEFVEAQQAAYLETAREDDEIAERMDAGRRALHARGRSETGPYQSPMEDGMQHFHEFYRRAMGPLPDAA